MADQNIPVTADGDVNIDCDNDSTGSTNKIVFSHDNGTELMRIQENGNVGIGTSSPSSLLDLGSSVNTVAPVLRFTKPTGGGATNWTIQGGVDGVDNGLFGIRDATANATRLVIDINGKVGVGTEFPGATLDVRGSVIINEDGADKDVRIEGDTDTTLFFTDASADKVGIGTSAPGAKLDIRGDVIINEDGADKDVRIEGDTDANLFFTDASADKVGIGTNAPGAKLQIETLGGSVDQLRLKNTYAGGATWSISVGGTAANGPQNLGFRIEGSNISMGGFNWTSTGNTIRSFRVGGDGHPGSNIVEALGAGQAPLLGCDSYCPSDSMVLKVVHGNTASSNNGATAQASAAFRNNQATGSGYYEAGYLMFRKVSNAEQSTLALATNDGTNVVEAIFINQSQQVGIGTNSPSHPLHMASGAHVTAAGVWTDSCSREYKKDITPLDLHQAITVLMALSPVKYKSRLEEQEKHVGFIAEEVPELVATRDRKGLSPMDIVAVLTKVVQYQQMQIEELVSRA